MQIISCPNCSTRVVLTHEGTCPSCRTQISNVSTGVSDSRPTAQQIEVIRKQFEVRRKRGAELLANSTAKGCLATIWGMVPLVGWAFSWSILKVERKTKIAAKKLMVPPAELILAGRTPPVVYLRSFYDDGSYPKPSPLITLAMLSKGDLPSYRATYEESLVELLEPFGPVVAIGRPNETLPELGASRMYVADAQWQAEVNNLLNRACLVVLRLGESEGLLWEVERVLESISPEKILLYSEPPCSLPEAIQSRIPCKKVRVFPRSRFVWFEANWTPKFSRTISPFLRHHNLYQIEKKTIITIGTVVALLSALAWMLYSLT